MHNIFKYLKNTLIEGVYYWRPKTTKERPLADNPTCSHPNNYPLLVRATVGSDYANDSTHRKSAAGIFIKITGGSVHYKTKFQATVSLSSTKVEFIAASDAAKAIPYVRSILDTLLKMRQLHYTKITKEPY